MSYREFIYCNFIINYRNGVAISSGINVNHYLFNGIGVRYLLFVASFFAMARNIIFMLKLMPTSYYHKTWVSKFIRKTITLCIVLPILSTIINVSGITFNDSIAKEDQLVNGSTARFYSYPGHLLESWNKFKAGIILYFK